MNMTIIEIILTTVVLPLMSVAFSLGYWYGYEKGKADGFERK